MTCSVTLELEGRFDARISGLLEKGGTHSTLGKRRMYDGIVHLLYSMLIN